MPTPASEMTRVRPALSEAVLGALAQQVRGAGMCLILTRADGTVTWHDPQAGVFFQRYVVPLLAPQEAAGRQLAEIAGWLQPQSAPQVLRLVPGVVLSAAPLVERRVVSGGLVLAGRLPEFSLGEDVIRECGRLALDGVWLAEQAQRVQARSGDDLLLALGMLLWMARDKHRVAELETELDSLSTQLANSYEELALLDQVSGGMHVDRKPSEFFRQVCLDVMQVISLKGMGVALVTEQSRQEPILYGPLSMPPGAVQRLGEQLMVELAQRNGPLLTNDVRSHRTLSWLAEQADRLIAVPLQRGRKLLGCLFGLEKTSGDFDSVDAKLLQSIASESAIYLENAQLFADVHGLMMGLLHSLTSAVDAKDAYTCGHSERVAVIARYIARAMKLPESQVEQTYMAGLLHDLGKIGVPEAVLQKAGRLTGEEYERIKKHPEIGARILADIKQLKDVVPGVMHHHERFDGAGYPAGLAGENIPLLGRIIGLADTFDAMTSSRTYRAALSMEVALEEIRRSSGTQFDPRVAETFLRIPLEELQSLTRGDESQVRRLTSLQEALRWAS